ncbi:peptidase inhibitor family I36 protein [Streptomyces sp. NPDC056149]|uniref:peptidase inhibitor family I36 protein n=1 Tax=unclassified Streptomyces TaxID=2593676 RepID=UPI0023813EA0|nr:peptidase inhibitor family I36 protein [Streptomyces sp. WZ-12]
MRIQQLSAALGPLAAAVALVFTTAVPTHATTGTATTSRVGAEAACPEGTVCFWSKPDFDGEMKAVHNRQHDCREVPFTPSRSVYNHAHETVSFYAKLHCSVQVGTLEPGGSARSVSLSSWR